MIDHFRRFAKAYSAGAAVLIIGPFAADIIVLVVWGLSLANITMPADVQAALAHIVTALAGGGAAAAISNSQS